MDMKRERENGSLNGGDSRRLDINTLIDIRWWLDVFLTPAGNRRPIIDEPWVSASEIELFTDACNTGYGARYGDKWFQGEWTPSQLEFARVNVRISIPYLELHALVHAAVVWGHLWKGKQIKFRCDAEAAVAAVQSMKSRNDGMSDLLRVLYATAARHQFQFECEHLPGVNNIVADALSRGCSVSQLKELLPTAEDSPSTTAPMTGAHLPVVPWELTATEDRLHGPPPNIFAPPSPPVPAEATPAPSPISASGASAAATACLMSVSPQASSSTGSLS